MSYEGREQYWCKNGHYGEVGQAYCGSDVPDACPVETCKSPIVFVNQVNDTNEETYGYITPTEMKPAVMCTCTCCGISHMKEPAVFEIPDKSQRTAFLV